MPDAGVASYPVVRGAPERLKIACGWARQARFQANIECPLLVASRQQVGTQSGLSRQSQEAHNGHNGLCRDPGGPSRRAPFERRVMSAG
jgi:hypothetical protein